MHQLLWLAITCIAGIATILGSLMALGSFLLWLVPFQTSQHPGNHNRLKLLFVSLILSLTGIGLLFAFPFPNY